MISSNVTSKVLVFVFTHLFLVIYRLRFIFLQFSAGWVIALSVVGGVLVIFVALLGYSLYMRKRSEVYYTMR